MPFAVLVIILFFFAKTFSAQYSLSELVDSAYRHSHLLAIADLQMKKSKEAVDEAKRKMLPTIGLSGNYSYAITPYNPMSGILSGTGASSLMNGFDISIPPNNVSGGIEMRQTFFAQTKLRYSLEYAQVLGRGLICRWQDVRMRVKANMTKLYYSALIIQEQTQIEKQSREIAQSRHAHTVLRFNSHVLSEIDTLNSFVDFSSATIRYAEILRNKREIYRNIAVAAGITESPDSIILSDTLSISDYQFDYNILELHFLAENKELRLLANEVDLAEISLKITKGDYFPTVYGGLSLNRTAQFENPRNFNGFLIEPDRKLYLGFSYDVTTFGQRKLRVKQSEYDLKIANHNYENKKEQLLLELKSNFEAINEEYAKVEEGKRILDAAQKALVLAQNRYKDGLISQTEMDIFEQRFRQSGIVYLSAISRYNSALIDLRIMGADYLYEPLEKAENEKFSVFNNFYLRSD